VEVIRPRLVETTALGAVFLAGLGAGIWQNTDAIREVWSEDRRFVPDMSDDARTEAKGRWKNALERV